jgi:macrolide transport system ATP-binding/permease protein
VTALITLVLGIGAHTAIFTLIHVLMLKSSPVADPAQLYRVGDRDDCCERYVFPNPDGDFDICSYNFYRHIEKSSPEFEQLAAVPAAGRFYSLRHRNAAAEASYTQFVSGNCFSTLGVDAYLGRVLSAGDDAVGATRVAVLSYAGWKGQFAGDPGVV